MSVKGVTLEYLDASEESGLIEAAQTGDRERYLRLVRHYGRPLYRAAYSMTRDPAKAEALTRDVFVRAWQRIHDFPRGQRFFPWLLRAARGLFPTPQTFPQPQAVPSEEGPIGAADPDASGTGTSGSTAPGADAEDAGWAGAGVPSTSPETAALAAFAELRPDEQMALSMRLLERISYEEIGAILDLSLGVVTLRMSQARGHLLPRAEALPTETE
ncbi:MAG TPA: sigma factor [Candidatus Eisenbacteria bacterium]|nr:sigma factor [Candidatus Eisenbacteria bacterium]